MIIQGNVQKITKVVKSFLSCRTPDVFSLRSIHHNPKEVTIKVPWGHISGRLWNESDSAIPFLCIHGWKDNAASFDRLIPLILDKTPNYQFLAIDLPGHGFSSHYPPGMLYQLLDHLIAIRRVYRHFGWPEKDGVHLLGHSLGAILSFLFAASHPNIANCVVALDALVPVIFNQADIVHMISITTADFLRMESRSDSKKTEMFDKAHLKAKMRQSHMGLDEIACEVMLTRAVIETPPKSGKWKFSHDPRVHFLPHIGLSKDQIEFLAKAFQSNLLHIKADGGVHYLSNYLEANMQEWLTKDNDNLIRFTTAKDCTHQVHLIEPEKVAPDILKFLEDAHAK